MSLPIFPVKFSFSSCFLFLVSTMQLFLKDKHGIWSGSGLGNCSYQPGNTEQPYWDYNSTNPIQPCQREYKTNTVQLYWAYNSTNPIQPCQREYKTNTVQPYWDFNSTNPIQPCQREYKTNTVQLYWAHNSKIIILSHHVFIFSLKAIET